MPRYFFDITSAGSPQDRDDEGTECADLAAVRGAAMRVLPDVARDDIPKDGDRQTFTVVARDEDGHAVYTAILRSTVERDTSLADAVRSRGGRW
ncbi:DUF6894 family protein, partial [Methylobacterium planeticum]|uniref:DUF6894 family protein n=1 Tax=Methylobacterium planeticum TaxID=2615211 RepID=UPI002AC321AC